MKSELEAYLEEARHCLSVAIREFSFDDYRVAVEKAYYCMFNCGMALLLTRNLSPKTHEGLVALFSREFIKTEILPKRLGQYLKEGRMLRERATYVPISMVRREHAEDLIEKAKEFLKCTEKHLPPSPKGEVETKGEATEK